LQPTIICGCGLASSVFAAGIQIALICAAVRQPNLGNAPAHSGASARGYQGLPAPLVIPATANQTAARSYFYASPALA